MGAKSTHQGFSPPMWLLKMLVKFTEYSYEWLMRDDCLGEMSIKLTRVMPSLICQFYKKPRRLMTALVPLESHRVKILYHPSNSAKLSLLCLELPCSNKGESWYGRSSNYSPEIYKFRFLWYHSSQHQVSWKLFNRHPHSLGSLEVVQEPQNDKCKNG